MKGVRFLAQAVAAIDDPRLHLVIAGEGSESAGIKGILNSKIKSGHAHFLGNVNHREMSDIYRGANASSLPSLMEGMSIAGLEAMASGLPLIASDVGGTPYIVQHGITGILTKPESSWDLKKGILRLLNNRELSKEMGNCGFQIVREQFTWEIIARQVLNIYTRTVTT